jgi:AraC-like DNA-binding protein
LDQNCDALSDVLRMVRLRACVYFVKDMSPPWGLDIPKTPTGPLHMVLQGQCWLRYRGSDINLTEGDAALLPHGAQHTMLDDLTTVPEYGPDVMERLMLEPDTTPTPQATRMLCGHFEWDGALDHPLFRELPDLIVVRNVFESDGAAPFSLIADLITREAVDKAPGSAAIADRMGEVLFVSLLRAWMVDQDLDKGILATMNDARLARALRHIHNYPGQDLDLATLASIAGMSRTSFAIHFHETMGKPPATYLAEWRMLLARRLLLRTKLGLPDIRERVGYESDAAFVRAFKRRFGETPARLRRGIETKLTADELAKVEADRG